MDIQMPVMDGVDAAAKILEMYEDIPIIAMTANIMPADVERYIATGMRECLGKPITSQGLIACLMRYMEPVEWKEGNKAANEKSPDELQYKLINMFVEKNQGVVHDISSAIDSGDIQLAHRIAHTLKGNAAQLRKAALQMAAEEMERCLKSGENKATSQHFKVLDNELSEVLEEFKKRIKEMETSVEVKEPLDKASTLNLLNKLKPLLEESDTECISYVNELRSVSGSETLIKQIEDFDFIPALESLAALNKLHGE
jgi:CheY-like chemotaxis protein